MSNMMLMKIYEAAERLKAAREEYVALVEQEVAPAYEKAHALKVTAQAEVLAELRRELEAVMQEAGLMRPAEREVVFRQLYAPWQRKLVG